MRCRGLLAQVCRPAPAVIAAAPRDGPGAADRAWPRQGSSPVLETWGRSTRILSRMQPAGKRAVSGGVDMAASPPELTLLQRREVEARIVGPLIREVIAELGEEKTLALVRRVIARLAREAGAELARQVGEASLTAFAACLDRWKEGGALEIEVLEQSPERLSFDVTRCRYAEMYRALGLADLGASLSC